MRLLGLILAIACSIWIFNTLLDEVILEEAEIFFCAVISIVCPACITMANFSLSDIAKAFFTSTHSNKQTMLKSSTIIKSHCVFTLASGALGGITWFITTIAFLGISQEVTQQWGLGIFQFLLSLFLVLMIYLPILEKIKTNTPDRS
jgi:hypothetical protein